MRTCNFFTNGCNADLSLGWEVFSIMMIHSFIHYPSHCYSEGDISWPFFAEKFAEKIAEKFPEKFPEKFAEKIPERIVNNSNPKFRQRKK